MCGIVITEGPCVALVGRHAVIGGISEEALRAILDASIIILEERVTVGLAGAISRVSVLPIGARGHTIVPVTVSVEIQLCRTYSHAFTCICQSISRIAVAYAGSGDIVRPESTRTLLHTSPVAAIPVKGRRGGADLHTEHRGWVCVGSSCALCHAESIDGIGVSKAASGTSFHTGVGGIIAESAL